MITNQKYDNTMQIMAKNIGDYVDSNGVLIDNAHMPTVMVRSSSDLANLPTDVYIPGSIAYTAGMTSIWQKAADGTWVEFDS